MRLAKYAIVAGLVAVWVFGLVSQFHSYESTMNYAVISLLMIGGTRRRQLVPGRIQTLAELIYEFVANMIRSTVGPEGMRFFSLVGPFGYGMM